MDPLDDMLGGPVSAPPAATGAAAKDAGGFDDFFGGGSVSQAPKTNRKTILTPDKGHGLQVDSCFAVVPGIGLCMDLNVSNKGNQPLISFAMQINKNVFGLSMVTKLQVPEPLVPGANYSVQLPLTIGGPIAATTDIQIALRTNAGVAYFVDQVPFNLLIEKGSTVEKQDFLNIWKNITEESTQIISVSNSNQNAMQQKMEAYGVSFVAKRANPPNDHLYYALRTIGNQTMLIEIAVPQSGGNQASVCCRSDSPALYPVFQTFLASVLN
jgi:hypothetical protein